MTASAPRSPAPAPAAAPAAAAAPSAAPPRAVPGPVPPRPRGAGGPGPAPAAPAAGHAPRVAFACRVDAADPGHIAGLPALLRSLALANPGVCEDFLLRHDGLPDDVLAAARRLHPRIVELPAGDGAGAGPGPYDDGLTAAYDDVVELHPRWLVAADLAVLRDPSDETRARHDLTDEQFWRAYCALPAHRQHPDLLLHYGPPLLRLHPTTDLARRTALGLRAIGAYEEAVDALSAARPRADQPRFHDTMGTALMAVSRYDEAETHLLLAAASPELAPKAFSQLARLAWLRGDEERSKTYAREGLDAEPTNRTCRAMLRGGYGLPEFAAHRGEASVVSTQLAHAAAYATGQENAGDKVLPEAVRLCFGTDPSARRWHPVPVHRLFDEEALAEVNARRGLVVGGGGLFLPDTWPNGNSAWQWNVPDGLLARIEVPLAVFAVGYNVFPGQSYRRSRFRESLAALVERSAFFGLRNRGSVERVRELLPERLRDRVAYQPCPTTLTRLLQPGWDDAAVERADTVLVNCAYDRAGMRFGDGYPRFLDAMARAVRALRERADVRVAAHMAADEQFAHDLRREHGIALPVEALYDLDNDGIRAAYRRARLVIGMRGHAGMIPFGCGTPVLSLVSHPKLAYFLADIDRPEWGVRVDDERLAEVLVERAEAVLDDHGAAVADVLDRQRVLWRATRDNLARLRPALGLERQAETP
ncbi:polysaccharide pyruvyl transferase family protein [Streptomyces sp. MAR4 CNY-716]